MIPSRVHRWMPCIVAGLILSASLFGAPFQASSGPTERMSPREGDNTIYFEWDAREKRVQQASSSRRLTANQQVELLTRLTDRSGRIVARGVLRNISQDRQYLVHGRLIHRIYRGGNLIRSLHSRTLRIVLGPGEKVAGRFEYGLRTGSYSVRTDFSTE